MDLNLNDKDVGALSDDQKTAVLESLFIAIGVDRKVSPEEGKRFEGEVRKLQWGLPDGSLSKIIHASRDRLNKIRAQDEWLAWIDEIAGRVPSEIRVKVIGTMTRLAFIPPVDQRERNILNAFLKAFEIPQDTVLALRKEFGVDA